MNTDGNSKQGLDASSSHRQEHHSLPRPDSSSLAPARHSSAELTARSRASKVATGSTWETLKRQSLNLNSMGARVFPAEMIAQPDGGWIKKPGICGFHGSSPFTSKDIARHPWADANQLGWALPPGLVILDIDVKKGKQGFQQLQSLEKECGELPSGPQQTTQSGGTHRLFRVPSSSQRFFGQVHLGDGKKADIDIVHAGNRYAVIYETEFVESAMRDPASIPWLPRPWFPAVFKPVKPRTRSTSPVHVVANKSQRGEEGFAVSAAIRRMETCTQNRNHTLNEIAFALGISGLANERTAGALRQAASRAGLEADEIVATLDSALTKSLANWDEPMTWLEQVRSDEKVRAKRGYRTIYDTSMVIARLMVRLNDQCVGLSVRQLSEELGVSKATAATALRTLVELGLLTTSGDPNNETRRFTP